MKIQELAIIFVIIILPISILLSEYTQFQIKTLNIQTEYDAKLTSATYDAIKAFQLNSQNETYSNIASLRVEEIEHSVKSFRNSIMSGFSLNGYTEDELNNYIPALVYTLYDGFYIYSPYKNINYRYETDEEGNTTDDPTDGNGDNLYGLKPYINYSCRYKRGNIDVVITYALDNYIVVRGKIGNEYVNKSGYLIDNIEVDGDIVRYNNVEIKEELLNEYAIINGNNGELYKYAKVNGIKYYLVNEGQEDECIMSISNGTPEVKYKRGTQDFIKMKNTILHNDSAKKYYQDAFEFTSWFKEKKLNDLTYGDAIHEVLKVEEGNTEAKIEINNYWEIHGANEDVLNKKIFDFNNSTEYNKNIENESSNFNKHRLAIIRQNIEVNLAIAIANYNNYSGVNNIFQMPELQEDEWEHITHNISLISFLQGLPIGGKIYNGYSLVTNSESEEVVLEDDIYILGDDKNYHKIGDNGLGEEWNISVDAGSNRYGSSKRSAGRLNTDFKRHTISNEDTRIYYYPLKDYNASYNSIVMQNNVTTYDDIYIYVNGQNSELKEAFYTAIARERYSAYKYGNVSDNYSVLILGVINSGSNNETTIKDMTDKLNDEYGIRATYKYSDNKEELTNWIKQEKENYNLIVLDSLLWPLKVDSNILEEVASVTNLITISNDATDLPMMKAGARKYNTTVSPQITEKGNLMLGGTIRIDGIEDSQAAFKFKDEVEVLYTGTYDGIDGDYDLIGCWKHGDYKWIHSQVSLRNNKDNEMKLFKLLVKYAMQ